MPISLRYRPKCRQRNWAEPHGFLIQGGATVEYVAALFGIVNSEGEILMAFCTNCGAALAEPSQFCSTCGMLVGAPATQASGGAAAGSGGGAAGVAQAVPPPNSGTPQNRITGTTMPVLEFTLQPNDAIISEAGELSWMGSSIQLTTHTQFAGGGGLFGVLKRVAGGGSIFMTEYRAMGAPGELAFATKLPGHIVPVEVSPGCEYMIHRHGFLCATSPVQISVGFQQSLGAGVFGGDGFLLQTLSGQGTAWLELSGELVTRDLQPGETLRVHPGHVGAFQTSVSFQITTVPGIKNMIFGGDGIFLAALTGPGRVWLQTLPVANLAHAIERYLRRENTRQTT